MLETNVFSVDERFRFLSCCLGAVDGTLIPIRFKRQEDSSPRFYSRKQSVSQNLVVMSGHDKTFHAASIMNAGSAGDGRILETSGLLDMIPGMLIALGYEMSSDCDCCHVLIESLALILSPR